MRVQCAMEVEGFAYPPWQPLTVDQYRANLAVGGSLVSDIGRDDPMLRMSGVTFGGLVAYGCQSPTRGRTEPTTGITFLSPDKLAAFVEVCLETGMQAQFRAHRLPGSR